MPPIKSLGARFKQAAAEAFQDIWKRIVDSFIGALATALIIGSGALVTGVIERIHQIDDLVKETNSLRQQLNASEIERRAAQAKLEKADSEVVTTVSNFKVEHGFILEELRALRSERLRKGTD